MGFYFLCVLNPVSAYVDNQSYETSINFYIGIGNSLQIRGGFIWGMGWCFQWNDQSLCSSFGKLHFLTLLVSHVTVQLCIMYMQTLATRATRINHASLVCLLDSMFSNCLPDNAACTWVHAYVYGNCMEIEGGKCVELGRFPSYPLWVALREDGSRIATWAGQR